MARLTKNLRLVARRVFSLARVGVAVAILAGLWFGTTRSVDVAVDRMEARRMQDLMEDRRVLVRALAPEVDAWLGHARDEARSLAEGVSARGAHAAIAGYMSGRRTFGRSALVVSPDLQALGASPDLSAYATVNLPSRTCSRLDRDGKTRADPGLGDLVARARSTPEHWAISALFGAPWARCSPAIAAAASASKFTAVVVGDLEALRTLATSIQARLRSGGHSRTDYRAYLVDRERQVVDVQTGRAWAPERVAHLLDVTGEEGTSTVYPFGPGVGTRVFGSGARLLEGWGLVLEQDLVGFELGPQDQPTPIVAIVLILAFAVVFALVAFFDVRRRRAHRRAEVAKSQFFSIAGHELRTPLTALRGLGETLSVRWNDLDDPTRQKLVERLAPQVRRLGRTLERILTAAAIQAGTIAPPRREPADVGQVLEDTATRFRQEAPLHTFEVDVPRRTPMVLADPSALTQVFDHLVDNAVKYSPEGGVVRLSVRPGRRDVLISVDDDGVGLPSDARRIFEPLVQGEDVDRRVHTEGGVGVGLFVVRTLVEAMGGRVAAQRRRGGGSSFTVRLRAAPSRPLASSGVAS